MSFTPRSVGLIVAAAAATGWLLASMTSNAPAVQTRGATAPRARATVAVPQPERLRERIPVAPQPKGSRNPFVYGQRVSRPAVPTMGYRAESPETAAPVIPMAPPAPVFRLSGIASNMENGAPVLTAIINDNGSLVFAKAGDKLSNGYSVLKVDELSVTLVDATGVTQTIRLP